LVLKYLFLLFLSFIRENPRLNGNNKNDDAISNLKAAMEISPAANTTENTTAHIRVSHLAIGILLTMLPVTMIVPVLKELVSARFQVDTFWAHAFMSTSLIGAIFFAPLAGMIIDRGVNRRAIFFFSLAGNAVCFGAMALAHTFPQLMIARFIEGAMHITALSAWLATGAAASPRGGSGRVMGALGGMIMLGVTVGVPLGGFIAGDAPIRVLWAAAIVSGFTAFFSLTAVSGEIHNRPASRLGTLVKMLRTKPLLGVPYAYSFIDRLCIGVVVSTLGLYMNEMLGLTPAQRGISLSFFLLPFALLAYPVGRLSDRIGRIGLMAGGSALFGVVFMSYGFVDTGWLTAVMIASGIFSAMMYTPTLALCKDLSSKDQYGAAFAGYNIAGSLGFIVGPLLGGGLFYFFKQSADIAAAYRWTFVITGSFEILCVLFSIPFLLRLASRKKRKVKSEE